MSQEFELIRDCSATVIPAGNAVTLPAGTVVYVTQTLGGNATVRTTEGLFRIESMDTDALGDGFVVARDNEAESDGAFSEAAVWEALKTCYDPEIPVNIVDLGLVYQCEMSPAGEDGRHVSVVMTLTAPGCGMGDILVDDVRSKLKLVPTITQVDVELTFDPPWNHSMMSEVARLETGMY